MRTRRQIIGLMGALPASTLFARAQEFQEYPLVADDGVALQNFRVPVELDPATLPGVIWKGGQSTDVILYEFFDYNCSFCRAAAPEIELILASDSKIRLGLINNAILSIGSVQAAKVQQAILRLHGPKAAYEFHSRMFHKRGQSDGVAALGVVRNMGLDPNSIEESGDSSAISSVLTRQAKLAASLGMQMTPSFAIAGIGLLGWPGPRALRRIIANARESDHPLCDSKG